ncbi:MAG: hypothetical protein JXB32_04670 [Deltaproteobacteria bacterium]|nr:hypothetical protein [Deltaproteobacteria bacterium]
MLVAVVACGTFAVAAASASEESAGYVDEDSERNFGILGSSSTFTGTSSDNSVFVGQATESTMLCKTGYRFVACVDGAWQSGGCYTGTGDLVLVYGYSGADSVSFAREDVGWMFCGGDWRDIYALDRATCPEVLVYGGDGDDTVDGSNCGDVVYGGLGNDFLDGWLGNDQLSGEAGNDVLWGYYGADLLDGGSGNQDVLYGEGNPDCLRDPDGWSTAHCGSGWDYYELSGSPTSCDEYGCIY